MARGGRSGGETWRGAGLDCEKPSMIDESRCACGWGPMLSASRVRQKRRRTSICLAACATQARPRACVCWARHPQQTLPRSRSADAWVGASCDPRSAQHKCGAEQAGGGGEGAGAHLHGGEMQLVLEHKVLPRELHERVFGDRAAASGALAFGGCLLFQLDGEPRRVRVRGLQVAVLLRAAGCGHAEGAVVCMVHGTVERHLGRAPAIGKRRHEVGVRLRHPRASVLTHLQRVVGEVVLHGGPRGASKAAPTPCSRGNLAPSLAFLSTQG